MCCMGATRINSSWTTMTREVTWITVIVLFQCNSNDSWSPSKMLNKEMRRRPHTDMKIRKVLILLEMLAPLILSVKVWIMQANLRWIRNLALSMMMKKFLITVLWLNLTSITPAKKIRSHKTKKATPSQWHSARLPQLKATHAKSILLPLLLRTSTLV